MEISRARLLLSLGVGIVAISTAAVFIRLAQAEGVPSLSIAAWRLTIASAILLPYAWATRRAEMRALTRRELALLAASGVFLGLHFATWIGSLGLTSVASSVVLVSMGPVFVGLGSWLFLRERPNLQMAAGIVLAAAGSIIISWGDFGQGQDYLLGDLRGELALLDLDAGAERFRRQLQYDPIFGVSPDPEGARVAVALRSSRIHIVDSRSGETRVVLEGHQSSTTLVPVRNL